MFWLKCPQLNVLAQMSPIACSGSNVPYCMFWLKCPRLRVLAQMSPIACSGSNVPDCMFWLKCPQLNVLAQMSPIKCSGSNVPGSNVFGSIHPGSNVQDEMSCCLWTGGSRVQIPLQLPRKDLGQVLHVAAVTKCVSLCVNGLPKN